MERDLGTNASPRPVTMLITRRVLYGQTAAFKELMQKMEEAAQQFSGHMGGFLIEPEHGEESCYHMLFAFDSQDPMKAWIDSNERRVWLERIADVTHGDAFARVLSGLEAWFAIPVARTKPPPPRWKMAIVTWMGIYPLVLLATYTVMPMLSVHLHRAFVMCVSTALIVTAMTWLVMPLLVRLFAAWLFPLDKSKL